MHKYRAVFMGSLGVVSLEVERTEMSDERAKEWLARVLPSYWPVYYNAAIYNMDDEAESKLVANYVSQVTVKAV